MTYIAIMSFAWGKGATADEALAQMAKAACQKLKTIKTYNVYLCGPTARVNEDGALVYKPAEDDAPALVHKVKNGKTETSRLYENEGKQVKGA